MAHWEWVCPLPGWLWGTRKGILQFRVKVAMSKSGEGVPTLSPLQSGSYILFPVGLMFLVPCGHALFLYWTTALTQPFRSQQAFQPPAHWIKSPSQPESK